MASYNWTSTEQEPFSEQDDDVYVTTTVMPPITLRMWGLLFIFVVIIVITLLCMMCMILLVLFGCMNSFLCIRCRRCRDETSEGV